MPFELHPSIRRLGALLPAVVLSTAATSCARGSAPDAVRPPIVVAAPTPPQADARAAGEPIRTHVLGGERTVVSALALSRSSILAGGSSAGSALVASLDFGGVERWQYRATGSSAVTAIAAFGDGRSVATGVARDAPELCPSKERCVFAVALDNAGNRIWSHAFATTKHGKPKVALDTDAVYLMVEGEHRDPVLMKLDARGRQAWSRVLGRIDAHSLTVGRQGPIVGGNFADGGSVDGVALKSAGMADGVIVAFDGAGRRRWIKTFGGTGNDRASALATDDSTLAMGGFCSSRVQFDQQLIESKTLQGPCIAVFDTNGRVLGARHFGGERGSGWVSGIAFTGGRLTVTGTFGGVLDLGGSGPLAAYKTDTFVAEFAGATTRFSERYWTGLEFGEFVLAADATRVVVAAPFSVPVAFGSHELAPPGELGSFVVELAH